MAKGRQASEPLPYYKWYWRDWRGSRAVQKMTALQRGIYRELLDEQWRLGALQNNPQWLASAAACTIDELIDAWPVLSVMFDVVGPNGEYLINERLEAERTEADRLRVDKSRAGAIGGKAKASAKQPQADAKHLPYSSSRAEQSRAGEQKQDGPAAVSILGILSAGPCAWCGVANGTPHLPDCRPQRVPGPGDE